MLSVFRKIEQLAVLLLVDYNVIDPDVYLPLDPDDNINDQSSPLELFSFRALYKTSNSK